MPRLIVTDREGRTREVEGAPGQSVMEVIRANGFDEMLALCGGCCSCATCHVQVAAEWLGALPPMTEFESELLDCSEHRAEGSRLSCEIRLSDVLDGLQVTIAAED